MLAVVYKKILVGQSVKRGYMLKIKNYSTEREGFEPSIRELTRITV